MIARVLRIGGKVAMWFVGLSVLWVVILRFVPVPFTFTMMGDLLSGHSITKQWKPLSEIDPNMARAAIAGEDARFCSHHGFDYKAIAGAAWRNAEGGRVRGGSTISQQTAKNVFLFQGGGYVRKAFEAWFTVLIETIWGKRRIMEMYLNVAETGEAGAMRYFNHSASHLTPLEAARIAAVLPLPKKREAVDPEGFVRRHGNRLASYVGVVKRNGLDSCLK